MTMGTFFRFIGTPDLLVIALSWEKHLPAIPDSAEERSLDSNTRQNVDLDNGA